tara:strand:+ start:42 stop:539 length:498 start_codon:yes stop_codon:yes gene_type:complete
MSLNIQVTLSEAEQKLSTFLGKQRYTNARNKGIKDNKIGDQSNYLTDLEGMAAEIAACRMLNVYPDLQTIQIPVHDLITSKGYTVDVKVTKYETGKLLAVKNKINSQCDYYMLMIGEFPTYRCAGFASSKDLLCDKTLTDLGKGNGHALKQEQLMPYEVWSKIFN